MCLIVPLRPGFRPTHWLEVAQTHCFAVACLRACSDPRQSRSPSAPVLSEPTVAAGRFVKAMTLSEHVCSVLFPARGRDPLGLERQGLCAKAFSVCVCKLGGLFFS